MTMNSNSIRMMLDRILSTRSIGLLMVLSMSIILIGSPSLVAAQSSYDNETKVTAPDGAGGDRFGYSVAISGDTMVVGADYNSNNIGTGNQQGSAYIFERDEGGTWGFVTQVTAFDAAGYDFFGQSVAISGDTIVIGAFSDDHNGSSSGSAYIFSRDEGGENNWGLVKKVTAFDAADSDRFGYSVAISGDTVVIGAYLDDDNGYQSGSGYIFKRDEGGTNNWGLTQKVTASDAGPNDFFLPISVYQR